MNKQPEEKKPAAEAPPPVVKDNRITVKKSPQPAPAPERPMRCVGVNASTGEAVMEPMEE